MKYSGNLDRLTCMFSDFSQILLFIFDKDVLMFPISPVICHLYMFINKGQGRWKIIKQKGEMKTISLDNSQAPGN